MIKFLPFFVNDYVNETLKIESEKEEYENTKFSRIN